MGQCCSQQSDEIDFAKSQFSGPVKRRSCTDVPCCLLFIVFLVGFLVVTLWSFAMGDYRRVVYPTDSKGRVCGTDVPGKPYLYFFDLQTCVRMGPALMIVGCPTPQVCVSACPKYYWSWKVADSPRESMICLNGLTGASPEYANQTIESLVKSKKCAPYIYHSAPILGRCMPSQLKRLLTNGTAGAQDQEGKLITLTNAQSESVSGKDVARSRKLVIQLVGFFEKVMSDLSKCWPVILVCLLSALVLGFSWIVLLRFCAGFMVWTTLIVFVVFFSFATGFCFYRWSKLRNSPAIDDEYEVSFYLSHYFRSSSTWLAFAIICTIILVIIVILLIFLRKRIRVAIGILNETSKAVASMTSVLLWPLMPLILELIVVTQCVFVAICLRSIVDPIGVEINNQTTSFNFEDKARQDLKDFFHLIPCDPTANGSAGKACRFLYYGDRKYTIFLQFFNLFMFFWLANFVKSLAEMTLAGTFAHYYFSRLDSSKMPNCPLLNSFFRAGFYHIGSLAFGSFLIALFQWLRALFEYIDAKLKKADNAVARFFMKCLCCCLWCLEKFLRFLNRNAFIMIAIYGQSFCSASRSALHLLARNIVRLVVVDKVTDFILFIGKILVVGAISGAAYCYLEGIMFEDTAWVEFQPTLHYPFVPLLIIIISSYIIVTLFSSVYEMGVDTIFLCFLEDLEHNDGTPERPYYMSKELMAILGKQNKFDNIPKEA